MNKQFFKGLFTSIGIVLGIALSVILVVGGISFLLNDNALPWLIIIFLWFGVPFMMLVEFVLGIVKYIKSKEKFWLGFTLGTVVLGILILIGGIGLLIFETMSQQL